MGAYLYVAAIERDHDSHYLRNARNYLNYIKTRRGCDYQPDRPRHIFDANKNDVKTEFVLAAVEKQPLTKVGAYFATINPNSYRFDCQRLVRFVFREYKIVRNVELEWFSTIHNHTEHSHAHIIIMPTDARDRSSEIRYVDKYLIRYLTNQWLEKHLDSNHGSRSAS